MGILWRAFAPKPLKKARRATGTALHPVHAVGRAVTPAPVKKAKRAMHPAEFAERKAEDAVVNTLRGKQRNAKTSKDKRAQVSEEPRTARPEGPPPWQPRPGWGTIRRFRKMPNEHGGVDIAFQFVPDDGTRATPVALADTEYDSSLLADLGDFARGIMSGSQLTVKAPAPAVAEVEDMAREINGLGLAQRVAMFDNQLDVMRDCGWAWTEDFKLVKAAPGMKD